MSFYRMLLFLNLKGALKIAKGTKRPGGFWGRPGKSLLLEAVPQSCRRSPAGWRTLSEAAFPLVTGEQGLRWPEVSLS